MSFQHIEYSVEQGVAILTLNRPAALNSFNADMHLEVKDALKQARANEQVRCLLITGNGRGFCAGQDLSDRNVAADADMPDLGASIEKKLQPANPHPAQPALPGDLCGQRRCCRSRCQYRLRL